MGQKVSPIGLRLGITKTSSAQWMPEEPKQYKRLLQEDKLIRSIIKKSYPLVQISNIFIAREDRQTKIKIQAILPNQSTGIHTPFIDREEMRQELEVILAREDLRYKRVTVGMVEIENPPTDVQFIAASIAAQLQMRKPFRAAIKRAIKNTKVDKNGSILKKNLIKGIKIQLSGRLNGVEMARTHWVRDGQVPLHTLKADIDYCSYPVPTRYGILGLKVWVCNS